MNPLGVVNVIEKLANPVLCVREVLVITEIHLFIFERANDALDKSVFSGTTCRRHAHLDIGVLQQGHVPGRAVLNPLIRMMDRRCRVTHKSLFKSGRHQFFGHVSTQMPAANGASEQVENDCQIDPLLVKTNVGEVTPPDLIGALKRNVTDQIGIFRQIMAQIGEFDEVFD